ncbi:bifunctional phosphoribosylaminoimidazolecarboxamide formyltransferase/IMP cyclohydrolase [Alphaproteobacteria bacterium]|nr:bifunctional phosphoribosylaminoimidazolecarboxamide formyltransferase/IMP cyclohydrolase [Alphaproteobacteria bacterium]
MKELLNIKRSLISVSNKKNIVNLAGILTKAGVEIISTGNTYNILVKAKVNAKKIDAITKFPEILNGRVKTLHPNIFGGILADLKNQNHADQIKKFNILKIQLLIVNLYPFEETIKKTNSIDKCIENIDVGGPSLIRAAAKNYLSTAVVVDIQDYEKILQDIKSFNGITLELRKELAVKAFKRTMEYDTEIFKWYEKNLSSKTNKSFFLSGSKINSLRYGENPHQKAEIYTNNLNDQDNFYKQLHGKELSFNNLNDLNTALSLLSEFKEPTSVIIKHAIPCGVAESKNIFLAWRKAFLVDSLSAFGGVVALNRKVEKKLALDLSKIFLEVIVAKDFSREALEIFKAKPNLRIITVKSLSMFKNSKPKQVITIANTFLVQDRDHFSINKRNTKIVSEKKPTKREMDDLIFANKVVKHVRSNAIVIAKNKTTIGIGSGNTSRVDSVKFAIEKSKRVQLIKATKILSGSVMASDAFFPFTDSIKLARKSGVSSIIQPGGSIKDKNVIEEANKSGLSMIFTNKRCFSH